MTPKWHAIAGHDEHHQIDALLADENDPGSIIAMVEYFGHGCHYPCAINAATGNLERGGPMDGIAAVQWAERVAGLHPPKPGDERPPFYYRRGPDGNQG